MNDQRITEAALNWHTTNARDIRAFSAICTCNLTNEAVTGLQFA